MGQEIVPGWGGSHECLEQHRRGDLRCGIGPGTGLELADLALVEWMLKPDQQAIAYDDGYFYPGPAVKDVTLSMAPEKSQQVIAQYGRLEYDDWISKFPTETSLPADQQVAAFDKWNRLVGSTH